jgi:site-specific DNA recombinase
MARAVIYCRVSTKEQTQNLSLPTQRRACEDYCRREGIEVARVFMERGESAKTANRPELQAMLAFCRQNKKLVQFVVVYNLSRFSRESGAHHALRGMFAGVGIVLRSVTEPIDESPTGRLMESFLASIAQFDNDVKAERTRVGMRTALEAGRWTFQAPLGYRTGARGGPSLVHDPEQAALVRQAFEAFDSGRLTVAALREQLRRKGLATRHGRPLAPQTLRTLLRNPIYCGRVEVSKWGISVAGDFDGIVSLALFARVQARLAGRAAVPRARTRNHPDFPLRRFVRCGECDRPMTGSWSKGRGVKYAYYHCPGCGAVRVSRDRLEARFRDLLARLQPRAGYLRLFGAVVMDQWRERQKESCVEGARLAMRVEALNRWLDDLDDAFLHAKVIDKRTYDRQRDRLREQLVLAEVEAAEATGDEMDVAAVLAFAEAALTDVVRLWDTASPEQKQRLQAVFFPEGVTFDGENIRTVATCLAFTRLAACDGAQEAVASPTGFEAIQRDM